MISSYVRVLAGLVLYPKSNPLFINGTLHKNLLDTRSKNKKSEKSYVQYDFMKREWRFTLKFGFLGSSVIVKERNILK